MKSEFAISAPCLIKAALVMVTSSCLGLASLPKHLLKISPENVQGDAQAYAVCISSRCDHPVRLYFN